MVCVACLLPLFMVPIVSFLPILFDYIMMKVYALFGWEYRKPERVPPACPIKPSAAKNDDKLLMLLIVDGMRRIGTGRGVLDLLVGTTEGDPLLPESVPKQQVGEEQEHNKNE